MTKTVEVLAQDALGQVLADNHKISVCTTSIELGITPHGCDWKALDEYVQNKSELQLKISSDINSQRVTIPCNAPGSLYRRGRYGLAVLRIPAHEVDALRNVIQNHWFYYRNLEQELAQAVVDTINLQRIRPVYDRRTIRIFSKDKVALASDVVRRLPVNREKYVNGAEIERTYSPQEAAELLRWILNDLQVSIEFEDYDKPREPYRILCGQKTIELA